MLQRCKQGHPEGNRGERDEACQPGKNFLSQFRIRHSIIELQNFRLQTPLDMLQASQLYDSTPTNDGFFNNSSANSKELNGGPLVHTVEDFLALRDRLATVSPICLLNPALPATTHVSYTTTRRLLPY